MKPAEQERASRLTVAERQAEVRRLYPTHTTRELAELLGVGKTTVASDVHALGLETRGQSVEVVCAACGKTFQRPRSSTIHRRTGQPFLRQFCSKTCGVAERRGKVAELRAQGLSITAIALELGVNRGTIGEDVQKLAREGVIEPRPRGRIPGTKLGRESCEKIAAAKRGKPRPDVAEKLTLLHADPEQHRRRMLRMIEARKRHNVKGSTKRTWKNRVNGYKGHRPANAERDWHQEAADKVLEYHRRYPSLGERTLAPVVTRALRAAGVLDKDAEVTRYLVRQVLARS
jgi:transposase